MNNASVRVVRASSLSKLRSTMHGSVGTSVSVLGTDEAGLCIRAVGSVEHYSKAARRGGLNLRLPIVGEWL